MKTNRRGILIGGEERGKHSIGHFPGPTSFLVKELMGITLASVMRLAGPYSYSFPELAAPSKPLSSEFNYLFTCFFQLLDFKPLEGRG